ncbi:hypothetical protein MP228_006317 [Amoeboaphelidium protococcarum]|nr:hypothetical protein MP228_006317 [Amoeboaphelidium protococcarum]
MILRPLLISALCTGSTLLSVYADASHRLDFAGGLPDSYLTDDALMLSQQNDKILALKSQQQQQVSVSSPSPPEDNLVLLQMHPYQLNPVVLPPKIDDDGVPIIEMYVPFGEDDELIDGYDEAWNDFVYRDPAFQYRAISLPRNIVYGSVDGVVDIAEGTANVFLHPVRTAKDIADFAEHAITDPVDTVKGVGHALKTHTMEHGLGHAFGEALPQAALLAAPFLGTSSSASSSAATVANAAQDVADVGNVASSLSRVGSASQMSLTALDAASDAATIASAAGSATEATSKLSWAQQVAQQAAKLPQQGLEVVRTGAKHAALKRFAGQVVGDSAKVAKQGAILGQVIDHASDVDQLGKIARDRRAFRQDLRTAQEFVNLHEQVRPRQRRRISYN